MNCRLDANEGEPRVRCLGWCYEHKQACGFQPQRKPIKIRAKNGEIIDLSDIRKEQVYIGNPYALEVAILIKRNTALIDALEAACNIPPVEPIKVANEWDQGYEHGYAAARTAFRRSFGVIEETT